MAVTVAGRRLSDAHRIAQSRIAEAAVVRMLRVWPLLNPDDLDATTPAWLDASTPIVTVHHTESAALSDAYYRRLRDLETDLVDEVPSVTLRPLPSNQVATSLVVTGPVSYRSGSTWETAAARSAAAASRLGASGGRDRIGQLLAADPSARRVRRITSPNCCAFCAMLATRDQLPPFASYHFEAHDNCQCQPEPAWDDGAGQTELARRFATIYTDATAGVPSGGNQKLNAFRRSLEASRT